MLAVERLELRARQVEDADAAVLQHQRNHELGSHVGHAGHVARILRHVADEHRFLVERGIADEPLAEVERRLLAALAELHRHLQFEPARGLVEQQHAEAAVVDDALDELGQAGQQLLEIENRGELAPDLGERLEGLAVATLDVEEPRVLERDGDERRELPEERDVGLVERVVLVTEDVEGANDPRLVDERHHERRAHPGHEVLVARVAHHVLGEDGAPLGDGRSHQPLADLQAHPLGHARRVPEWIGNPQLFADGIQEIHRERIEGDHPPQQLVDLAEELVEIQDRGDLMSEVEEREELLPLAGAGAERRTCRREMRHG